MHNSEINIRATRNGPYIVEKCSELITSQGDQVATDPYVHLCRCGKSKNKPFCDNTHEQYGFRSRKLGGAQPDEVDRYDGKEITIFDNRGVCSHRGHCTTNLPRVFIQGSEPWINPDGADPKEIARVIRMCPSGALSYEWRGERFSDWTDEQELELSKNGPIEVRGHVPLHDEDGSEPQTGDHYTLCRCGGSKNKPFCDGTHWYNGFRDEKADVRSERPAERHMARIHSMAATGASINEPMGTELRLPSWDSITIHGAQLASIPTNEDQKVDLSTVIGPNARRPLEIDLPVYVTHMSYGALSAEAKTALAIGSAAARTAMCSGEGGILEASRDASYRYIFEYVQNEYSVSKENLEASDAVEIKIGQAVKPGIGGHYPAAKITPEIALVRNRPMDRDIVTPARYHDISDADSLREKLSWLRDLSGGRPIGVKIAAGNVEADLAVALAAQPDFITIDGKGGATGSVPKLVKDAASVPTLYALVRARDYFDRHGVSGVSLVITGGLRVSSDVAKALALGADAVAIGTAALMAIGCRQYRICNTGRCPTGVTSQDPLLRSRIDVPAAGERLANFFAVTRAELETFTRMTGHRSIHELSRDDISATDPSITQATGVRFAGAAQIR